MKIRVVGCGVVCFLLAACSPRYCSFLRICDNVESVTGLRQDAEEYPFDSSNFKTNIAEFKRKFFSPWNVKVQQKLIDKIKSQDYIKYFGLKNLEQMYAENLQRWPSERLVNIQNNMQLDSLGKVGKRGIIIRNTMCKLLPTDAPFFSNVYAPGGSYPFDENIQSLFRIGLPIFISHLSRNKEWAFVCSEVCLGWVKCADLVCVDKQFVKHYTELPLGVFVKDGISICSANQFHEISAIGLLLPKIGQKALIPRKTSRNMAFLSYSQNKFQSTEFAKFPCKFNQKNVHNLVNGLLGNPYSWGGNIYGGRDCSLILKDFMGVFGRYLPRNGKDQIASRRHVIDLTKVDYKALEICKFGVPFQSLIYLPGHIMLYVGQDKECRPVFFHNCAGLCRFYDLGRFFIGCAILSHGDDTKRLYPDEKTLLHKITKMSVL